MESVGIDKESSPNDGLPKIHKDPFIITTSNWKIANDKNLDDCISTLSLSQAPESTNLEDVVSLDTCVALESDPSGESCKLEFKLTNKQKIARIAVVSEASVLEFFKQCGEYATTSFAEFVDEFQDHAVYFAEAKIQPPSAEASIKFTRTKNKGSAMWIYGIKLILTESSSSESSKSMLDLDVINSLLSNTDQQKPDRLEMAKRVLESFAISEDSPAGADMSACLQQFAAMKFNPHRFQGNNKSNEANQLNSTHTNLECNGESESRDSFDLKTYIDDKFASLERRLIERIDIMDQSTNQKLDAILKRLELNVNNDE